jgi:peptidyl-prolyl cis-trans isomerase SurA
LFSFYIIRTRAALGAVFFVLAISASAISEIKSPKPVDRIAAVVGGDIILLSEVQKEAAPALKEIDAAESQGGPNLLVERKRAKLYKDTLDEMINDTLIAAEARDMQLEVGTEEIDRAIERMADENNIDRDTFLEAVKAQGTDVLSYRATLRKQILRYKVLNLRVRGRVKISEAEARQYYNDQVRDVRATGSFEGAHILIRVDGENRAAEVAAARKRAEEIIARIQHGEDFAEAAKTESEDKTTAPRGGSLGALRPGTIPPVLDRAFLDLEKGEIAGPIRTTAGYHIIKLINREALGVQRFAEVKGRIMAQLAQDEMIRQEKIWIKELKIKTFIDIRL